MHPVIAAESVTELGASARGAVLVVGSHAGVIAVYLGAAAGAHALILNDAGVGLEGAGIAGLAWLQGIGMAACAVAHTSARIGDGADSLARGVISHCNHAATQAGVRVGMAACEAAKLLAAHEALPGVPSPYRDGRYKLAVCGGVEVWALDSVGKLVEADEGRILLIGSHGALHGGRPDSALNLHGRPIAARAALFNDAGVGIDAIGITRLPELARRGIPAATVDCMSARIGEGRSMWESGVLSHVNPLAAAQGARPGQPAREWVESLPALRL